MKIRTKYVTKHEKEKLATIFGQSASNIISWLVRDPNGFEKNCLEIEIIH